jgi:uncharacterized protein (TIGR03643 family)
MTQMLRNADLRRFFVCQFVTNFEFHNVEVSIVIIFEVYYKPKKRNPFKSALRSICVIGVLYFYEQSFPKICYYYMKTEQIILTDQEIDRVIEMAWEDRTPFDAITAQFGLKEQEVIEVMRKEMKPSSFRMWRERVQGRATKHSAKSVVDNARFKSTLQKKISLNKISKRK